MAVAGVAQHLEEIWGWCQEATLPHNGFHNDGCHF